ncbi:polyprenyl synthetase [Bacteroidia bacterium]|nr:polyprenyl synthetase [Bacteroidia bacterium]
MKNPLKNIRATVEGDWAQYERFLRKELRSDSPYVHSILNYVFANRGKGLRPLLVLLCSALNREERPADQATFIAAMMVEMIHTASLVHDDVVDEAYMRHNHPSVNALWRSRNAVLTGDFILARCFSVGLGSGQVSIVTHITRCIDLLSEGELQQNCHSQTLSLSRQEYMEIIYKKTASLLSACCTCGAMAAGADHDRQRAMKFYGDQLGLAFQIRDDILDYLPGPTGKPHLNDLRERKITLPLLTVLETIPAARRHKLLRLLSDVRSTPSNAALIRDEVIAARGIEMAEAIMDEHLQQACRALDPYPASPFIEALVELTRFVGARKD